MKDYRIMNSPVKRKITKSSTPKKNEKQTHLAPADQFMDAALDILAKEGVAALSLDQVAKRCHFRRSHVAYYFTNTEGLLEATIQRVVELGQIEIMAKLADVNTPREKFECLIRSHVDYYARVARNGSVFALLFHFGTWNPRYQIYCTDLAEKAESRLASALAARFNIPYDKIPKKILDIAKFVRCSMIGTLLTFQSQKKTINIDATLNDFLKMVEELLVDF